MSPLIPYFDVPILRIPIPGTDIVLPLHGFGLLVATGFLVGSSVAQRRATAFGLDADVIYRLVTWLVIGTFVGGHVGYGLMYAPDEYLKDPIQFLYFWQGLSSFGGFVVCVPLSVWFFWKEKVDVWKYLDCLAHGMAIGWFFGRMGCFVAHDHPGTPTDFYLGVYGICTGLGKDVACHDMGLYEALWSLAMFGVLVAMDRARKWKAGVQVLIFGLSYGPVRFAMDFLRPEVTDARYWGYTPGQYGSALLTVVCFVWLVQRLRADVAPYGRPETSAAA